MSIKKVMMAFQKLAEDDKLENVTMEDIIAHDVTGHLARMPEEKLRPLLSIGATKSGWGLSPRTHSYSKY